MTAERAVKILDALVEQGPLFYVPNPSTKHEAMFPALVDGAKVILCDIEIWKNHALENTLISLTQAYARRMKEAGMEVPE